MGCQPEELDDYGGSLRPVVTEGALVAQTDATPMAVVQQIDPLYINFTQSASAASSSAATGCQPPSRSGSRRRPCRSAARPCRPS